MNNAKKMKRTSVIVALAISAFLNGGKAEETAPPAAGGGVKPVRLTAEMRQKLTERRQQVSSDSQYGALLKVARQAQERADDYFLAKLQQAVADDEKLSRYVADLIKQQRSLRGASASETVAQ